MWAWFFPPRSNRRNFAPIEVCGMPDSFSANSEKPLFRDVLNSEETPKTTKYRNPDRVGYQLRQGPEHINKRLNMRHSEVTRELNNFPRLNFRVGWNLPSWHQGANKVSASHRMPLNGPHRREVISIEVSVDKRVTDLKQSTVAAVAGYTIDPSSPWRRDFMTAISNFPLIAFRIVSTDAIFLGRRLMPLEIT
jgi:hypothetical protein